MSKPKPRPQIERALAAQRLAIDPDPLQPITELTAIAGMSPKAIERWIRHGRSGVYLDGVLDQLRGWCTTLSAVRRATRQRAEAIAARTAAEGSSQ